MYVWLRHLRTWWLATALCLVSLPASAWVETSLRSHVATIDVSHDGRAIVAHELMLKVRGGPLTGIELAGVDADAELLPDALVVPADSDVPAGAGHPLLIEKRDDQSLKIEIDHEKGIRRGSYLFKFRYRTNLLARERIRPAGSMVELSWIGPRLADGIDSARVVFRLPPTPTPPRVPESSDRARLGTDDEPFGVFLSNLRRAPDKDELEVVRPHVAAGEPVVWRVLASHEAIAAFAKDEPVHALESPPAELPRAPEERAMLLAAAALIALLYAALVLIKWRVVSRASKLRAAEARALIRLPSVLRAALAGFSLGAAALVAIATDLATLAGALLLVAMLLAAHASPRSNPAPRGPGRWLPLSEQEAFGTKAPTLPGRFLDAGAPLGFFLFVLALASFAAAAVVCLPRSPYHALWLAIGSACLLPIFCTGRSGELPLDPVFGPRPLLSWLMLRLADEPTLRVAPWARIPDAADRPDELRLLITLRAPLRGLSALEVGLESQAGSGGPIASPWVIVRALDGSPAHRALAGSVAWTRGRKAEERVAVVRPKLPTRALCLALVRELATALSAQADKSARISSGIGSSAAKPGKRSSPLHAT